MDKTEKALKKLRPREQQDIAEILKKLQKGDIAPLDIKKLKGHTDIYRVRKGSIRIIYRIENNKKIFILAIERRREDTYK